MRRSRLVSLVLAVACLFACRQVASAEALRWMVTDGPLTGYQVVADRDGAARLVAPGSAQDGVIRGLGRSQRFLPSNGARALPALWFDTLPLWEQQLSDTLRSLSAGGATPDLPTSGHPTCSRRRSSGCRPRFQMAA